MCSSSRDEWSRPSQETATPKAKEDKGERLGSRGTR